MEGLSPFTVLTGITAERCRIGNGAFANLSGGCNLIVVFSPDENSDEAAQLKVASDNEFGSNQEEINAVSPKVARIGLAYPQR
ncbi:hypothetical protein AA309_01510 [Microvirga vignae]|uniref:Uncharacterized protein n=1 Tax=Microvirga vignae TaxID=1225564 RepID=A0A0H1RJA0_9HYPH|nr:hypothetical protein [Microvirga vignae]KLK94901.1 hypothetical protein AA309_01510 [Microvirga vignae]